MKKILVIALVAVMLVSVFALAACSTTTKTAYGLVYNGSYVGKAVVEVSGKKIKSATLDEAMLPDNVTASEAVEGYTVSIEVTQWGQTSIKHYYKTVKFAGETATFDETEKTYKIGSKTMIEWLGDATNCEKYFEAVAGNKVAVVLANGEDTTIMVDTKLLKSKSGYWTVKEDSDQLGWKANMEATCKYVVENGFVGATSKDDFSVNEGEGKLNNEWMDKNGTLTGATWSAMYDYYKLLETAYNK